MMMMMLYQSFIPYMDQFLDMSGMSKTLVCLSVFIILSWLIQSYAITNVVQRRLPPGPTNWHVFGGCLPELLMKMITQHIHEVIESLSQDYGPVCLLSLPFGKRVIIVSGYEAVHEALTRPEFNCRPTIPMHKFGEVMRGEGLIMSSGEPWKEYRSLSLKVLRRFGVGRRNFEDQLAAECECLMTEIQSLDGSPFDPKNRLCTAMANVTCPVVMGKRFEYDDQELKRMLNLLNESTTNVGPWMLYYAIPLLTKISFLPRCGIPSMVLLRQKLRDIVDEHRDSFEEDNLRDFIDVCISNMLRRRKGSGEHSYMTDVELVAIVNDLFLTGIENPSTTLHWALLYMLMYPDVQKRVHEEIDDVVGRNRLPKLTDKPNLPYTEAVIHEIQRYGSVGFRLAPRYASKDSMFRDFLIPKDSYILTSLSSVTGDPCVWDDHDVFDPERFLDEQGKFMKIKEGIVFGAGPRACPGEQLSRMELFVFFTHLMHRFSFKKSSDTDTLSIQPKPGGFFRTPFPYKACAIERS